MKDKQVVIRTKEIIDIILENQSNYIINYDIMQRLDHYFKQYSDTFDEDFIRNYISFLEEFTTFFDYLMFKIEECEQDLLDNQTIESDYYFIFSLEEFKQKENLKPYLEMLNILDEMFPDNKVLQGAYLFLHINSLLYLRMFKNNKLTIENHIPNIVIDYGYRIDYYKEEYVTIFRHELEEGLRTSVFIDNKEIINYINTEIKELNKKLT